MRGMALSLSLFLLVPVGAAAQPSSAARQPTPAQQRQEQRRQEQEATAELSRLHASLHLTAAQEGAWRTYVAALGADQESETRRREADALLPTLTTPRRIALIEAALESDAAELRRQGAAVNAFYNQLTPVQQRVFDRETLPKMPAGAAPARAATDSNAATTRPR